MKPIIAIFALLFIFSCEDSDSVIEDVDFRHEMRQLVIELSQWSKAQQSDFIIIPQNGQALITASGETNGELQTDYIEAIDGSGRENMFFGYYVDDQETPEEDKQSLIDLCVLYESHGIEVLSTDYRSTQSNMDTSYILNEQYGFISFAANERELNNIPLYPDSLYNQNADNILTISDAQNFLYLINSENYSDKDTLASAVSATNYDLIIMDLYHDDLAYTSDEIAALKIKANGGSRLVVCYMSIGEAEDYRFYWNLSWSNDEPDWLLEENPDWQGNYKVKYWSEDWQNIIYGTSSSYLTTIMDAGFDGVYLDIIDAYEYFEEEG
jgi:cysteinyl-tRNA synthetase